MYLVLLEVRGRGMELCSWDHSQELLLNRVGKAVFAGLVYLRG